MSSPKQRIWKIISSELVFQLILISTVFLATAYDEHTYGDVWAKLGLYTSYVLASLIIGYVLLPKFFYPKKYLAFCLSLVLVIGIVMLVEEQVLEKIFFPTSRGTDFPGVFHTLLEILPPILILVSFKFAWDAQKKQNQLEELNSMMAESRLQFLKSQINPHFLFNNLNNLYSYALADSPKTKQIILELSSLLRYMLYDCQANLVPLEKEIQCLVDFIQLQEMQIEKRGKVEFNIDGKAQNQYIAPLILVVFVENCFKHSTSSQAEGIEIGIELKISPGYLELCCSNTYSSHTNTHELSKGIGLKNVRSRLALLYPNAHTLEVSTTGSVFQVHLGIALGKVQAELAPQWTESTQKHDPYN
ncbi:MAG: histidine kinase [Saprospiraceae bacterium]|nr:histidine kinase [Saprospiraceae bacterium]